jgi:hypothetical protein
MASDGSGEIAGVRRGICKRDPTAFLDNPPRSNGNRRESAKSQYACEEILAHHLLVDRLLHSLITISRPSRAFPPPPIGVRSCIQAFLKANPGKLLRVSDV